MISNKIKLLIPLFTLITIAAIIYSEQNNTPYSNFNSITNNTITLDKNTNKKQEIKLPDFSYNLLDINNFSLQQHNLYNIKSKKIILHFWASWCNICKQEFKDIISYAKNNPDSTVLTISIDDDKSKLTEYITKLDKQYHIADTKNLLFAWDEDRAISLDLFNSDMVPESFVISSSDSVYTIDKKIIGKANWANI